MSPLPDQSDRNAQFGDDAATDHRPVAPRLPRKSIRGVQDDNVLFIGVVNDSVHMSAEKHAMRRCSQLK